jgi:hypothetical protein
MMTSATRRPNKEEGHADEDEADNEFQISLMTSPADAACATPFGTLPTRLSAPLNVARLEPGTYTVTVNDSSTTFDYLVGQ